MLMFWYSQQLDFQTVLHLSSRLGHWKLTGLFCSTEVGADPNVRDIKNFTPLHYAALGSHVKDARILLYSGANVTLMNDVSTNVRASSEIGLIVLFVATSNYLLTYNKYLIVPYDANLRNFG